MVAIVLQRMDITLKQPNIALQSVFLPVPDMVQNIRLWRAAHEFGLYCTYMEALEKAIDERWESPKLRADEKLLLELIERNAIDGNDVLLDSTSSWLNRVWHERMEDENVNEELFDNMLRRCPKLAKRYEGLNWSDLLRRQALTKALKWYRTPHVDEKGNPTGSTTSEALERLWLPRPQNLAQLLPKRK